MNQILSTEDLNNKYKNNRKKGGKDIKSITKFFAIMLIIFGLFIIAGSAYALYKGNNVTNVAQDQSTEKPEIQIENKDENHLILTIMHNSEIREVIYYWNDEKVETINGEGRKYIQKSNIEIPKGENTFTVKVTDVNGQVSEYTNVYTLKSDIEIKTEQAGNNVKVKINSNEELKNIEYGWDNDEAKTLETDEKEYTFEVEVLLGDHTLKIKATDVKDNVEEKQVKVTGTTKPTVTIEPGDDCYVIKAHDDIALDRVEIETVADGKVTKMQPDGKDFEYKFPLKEGDENYIKVTAYNTKGVASKTRKAVWKK